jgi:hypothetical protein
MVIHATTSNAAIVRQAHQERLRTTGIGSKLSVRVLPEVVKLKARSASSSGLFHAVICHHDYRRIRGYICYS